MRATYMYGAGDVRVIDAPEPTIVNPTDAIVRVVRSCICGSDLHPYHFMPATPAGVSMGHEFLGVVEEAAVAARGLRVLAARHRRAGPGLRPGDRLR
jgi:threonine dehydrogenase-like Zn-dependent dehydrogenase